MRKNSLFILLIFFSCESCGIYSLSGAKVDPNLKTFNVQTIPNQAPNIIPELSNTLTTKLRTKVLNGTPLNQNTINPDLSFSGAITGYTSTPAAVQSTQTTQTASLNQLTITISIDMKDRLDDKNSWTQTFSESDTYSATADLNTVQNQLIDDITTKLVQDVFNRAFVNW
jgi:hypothetical protein